MKTNLVIFEGIASSGKTTLGEKLELVLRKRGLSVITVPEDETLMPIVENKSVPVALEHLHEQLKRLDAAHADIIILDRFHFTHIFRTASSIKQFLNVEKELSSKYKIINILLTVDPETVEKRIRKTLKVRGNNWAKGKSGTVEEKASYYRKQQKVLRDAMKESMFPMIEIDTTKMKWDKYIASILDYLSDSPKPQ